MSETMICLINDLVKSVEAGSMKKMKQIIQSLQPLLGSTDPDTTAVLDNEKNPLKDTNLIILSCKFGHLKILDYFLGNGKQFMASLYNGKIANVLSPLDVDREGHNAFYYAIRSNHLHIVELLLKNWLPSFDEAVARKDGLLSEAYEHLKLRNVRLTEEMEFLVVNEIISSRFNSSYDYGRVNSSRNTLSEKIDWLLTNIDSLETVEDEPTFLVLAKCIAQNMDILKHQLKHTYDTLPWEELQFCVITYVVPRFREQEKSIFPFVTMTKDVLLRQLGYFAGILKKRNKEDLHCSNEFPNKSREELVSKIKNNSPEFISLYETYENVRDLYSLEEIEEYLWLSISVIHNEKQGQLSIIRVLQVLTDYLKITLDSCKLSDATSRIILSALPKTTRNAISRANTLEGRLGIEKESSEFFLDTQNSLKLLCDIVTRILNLKKLKIVADLLEKITKSESVEEVCELGKSIKSIQNCIDTENFQFFEAQEIKRLIGELETVIPDPAMTEREQELIDNVLKSLAGTPSDLPSPILAVLGVTAVRQFNKLKFNKKLNESDLVQIKSTSVEALEDLSSTSCVEKVNKVIEFVKEIDGIIMRKSDCFKFSDSDLEKMTLLLIEIGFAAATKVEDVLCLEFVKNVGPLDSVESSEVTETELKDNLESKLTILKNLFLNEEEKSLRLTTEISLLDILSILDGAKCESDKRVLYVEEYTPVLMDKHLKNYLARGSALFDISPTDTDTAIQSNAILLSKRRINKCNKIGKKLFEDDVSKAKEKLRTNMEKVANQSQLFRALEKGDMETSLSLIKSGADVFGRSLNHESSLHFVAKSHNADLAKFIIEQNVGADLKDKKGRTALHVAAAHGNTSFVERLKENSGNLDLEQRDDKGRACLHLAAKNGKTEAVELFIKLGADLFSFTDEESPNDSMDVITRLFEKGADIFECGNIGRLTPLHIAAANNRVDVIKLILKKRVQVDIQNDLKATPLFAAAYNGCTEAAKVLIKAGANVNVHFAGIVTALHFTADKGHTAVAEILLQNGAEVDPGICPEKPIHVAVSCGQVEMVKLLIRHKANFKRRNISGLAPLHLAAQLGHAKVIEALLEAGVDVQRKCKRKATALHFAAASGCLEATKLLVEKGAQIDALDCYECTALHLAAEGGYEDVGKFLVNSGANINIPRNVDGCTPLFLATRKKANSLVRLLLEKGANMETKNNSDMDPVLVGSLVGNVEGVATLLEFNGNVNAREKNGMTPLHFAAVVGCCEMAELLLKNGADVNPVCHKGMTPLYAACENGRLNMVKLLVKYGANLNLGEKPPVIAAIEDNSEEILEFLVKQGADISSEDVLFKAVCRGYADCVRVLLENGFPINTYSDAFQNALQFAAELGFEKIASDLLHHGANVNSTDSDNKTPLHHAVNSENYEMVKFLLSRGANVESKTNLGHTALMIAQACEDIRIFKVLLANGADPLAEEETRESPLSQCVRKGDVEKMKALFESKAINKEVRFWNDSTPLHLSAAFSLDLVKFFVENDLVPDLSEDVIQPIHVACISGKQDIVEYFLDSGASVNEPCSDNQTPLHYAAKHDQLVLAEYLLSKGANVNAKDDANKTPLVLGRKNGNIVKLLFENGAFFDENIDFDDAAETYLDTVKLLMAVKSNDVSEVKKLIKKGGCLNAISFSSGSPLHFASCKGHFDIVKLLLENNANVNVLASKDCTPLHYAVKYSHENIVLELLLHGAVYNALTKRGVMPIRFATNTNIKELLLLIEKCFDLVEKGDVTVESTLQNLGAQNERHLKALVKTKNRNNQDIFQVADFYKYPRPNELFEICRAEDIKIDSQELSGRGVDKEIQGIQEWLARKNTPSASSVCQDNDVLLSLEKNVNDVKSAKQEKNCGTEKQKDVIATVLKGDLNLLKEAVQRGGSVNETDSNGRTALHYAVDRNDEKCVKFLLQNGADVTHASHKGNTALHTAVNKQSVSMVKILLEFAVNNRKLDFINKPTLAKGPTRCCEEWEFGCAEDIAQVWSDL